MNLPFFGKRAATAINSLDKEEVFDKCIEIMKIKNPYKRWRRLRDNEAILASFLNSYIGEDKTEAGFVSFMLAELMQLRKRERNIFVVVIVFILIAVLAIVTFGGK